MSRASVLARGRRAAAARMDTTVDIQFQTGTDIDPDTDSEVPEYTTAYTTPARIKATGLAVNRADAGGRTAAETTRELEIPFDSADPWADSRSANGVTALVTAVAPTDDPTLLGARLVLSGPAPGSQTTARRLEITEVVS